MKCKITKILAKWSNINCEIAKVISNNGPLFNVQSLPNLAGYGYHYKKIISRLSCEVRTILNIPCIRLLRMHERLVKGSTKQISIGHIIFEVGTTNLVIYTFIISYMSQLYNSYTDLSSGDSKLLYNCCIMSSIPCAYFLFSFFSFVFSHSCH